MRNWKAALTRKQPKDNIFIASQMKLAKKKPVGTTLWLYGLGKRQMHEPSLYFSVSNPPFRTTKLRLIVGKCFTSPLRAHKVQPLIA